MSKALVQLAVCGLHMRGQPLNSQLVDLGASFVRSCKSSPNYKLFAISEQVSVLKRAEQMPREKPSILPLQKRAAFLQGKPTKPGMVYVSDGTGNAINLEVWELEVDSLGQFMLGVSRPLGIGRLKLENGEDCLGFIAEGYVANSEENEDITHLGGWSRYIEALHEGLPSHQLD